MDVLFSVIVSAKVNPFEVVADENTLVCKAISIHRLYAGYAAVWLYRQGPRPKPKPQ